MTKTIKQKAVFKASPTKVYEALVDSKKHAAFTGAPARISRKVGGAFACYGGYINGINVELISGKRIVQAWRSRGWPIGHYSLVTFTLAKGRGGSTTLSFTQTGVPASDVKAKTSGWKSHYWEPLKAYVAK